MDAPIYRPAITYEQPEILAGPLNADTTSMARLMANPAAKAIVEQDVPIVKFLANIEQMKPHWDNVALRSFVAVGLVKGELVDAIDRRLRALPQGSDK